MRLEEKLILNTLKGKRALPFKIKAPETVSQLLPAQTEPQMMNFSPLLCQVAASTSTCACFLVITVTELLFVEPYFANKSRMLFSLFVFIQCYSVKSYINPDFGLF